MTVHWVSFDLKTGRRGPEVITRKVGAPSRLIGEATNLTLDTLCWDEAKGERVRGWDSATEAGRSGLAAINEYDQILWGGFILSRPTNDLLSSWVQTVVATPESYLDRRYVGDHTFTAIDQATIFTTLVNDALSGGVLARIDAPSTGVLRDRSYADADDKTVLSALKELMDVEGGLEFTAELEWADAGHTTIRTVYRARTRLGVASTKPAVTFRLPGNITSGSFLEDYSAEHGANDVLATSTGEGQTRPQSSHHAAILPTWVKYERRVSPSTSITDAATLDAHADAELAQTWDGLRELQLVARLDDTTSPTLWSLGDDVGVHLTCPRFPSTVDADGQRRPGYAAILRAIGFDMDLDALTITPRVIDLREVPA